ncbi:hypothetical protein GE061_017417 [Apolygus lucorum]|uniref:Uncharacterized protein n=1 Tax=Apolygus lucorum TaxID=248454 RepID=A0A8S9XCA2_APOLU|nr:hypothetical protein GE061_017417 [Apolygus lucorum]
MSCNIIVAAWQIITFVTENYLVFPRLLFVITYFSLIHQLSHYAFPARRRGNVSEWMLSMAIITQANETWKYITLLVEYVLRLYKQGEPYQKAAKIQSDVHSK